MVALLSIVLAVQFLFSPSLLGQGSTTKKKSSAVKPPKWYESIPPDSVNLVARGKAEAKDQQVAVDKAGLTARGEIITMLEGNWNDLLRAIREEGVTAQAPAWLPVTLKGSSIKSQKATKKGKVWTAFVLVAFPKSSIPSLLQEKARSDPQWYGMVKNTKAVQQLELHPQ